jgi:nucleoside-diphosphate kinase
VSLTTSAPVVVMVLSKPNAIADWRTLIGPTNSLKARESAPQRYRRRNDLGDLFECLSL